MIVDPRLRADIQSAESCRLVAYRDTKGFWTIGWGHLLPDQTADHTETVWTQAQADAQLDADIANANTQAIRLAEWPSLDTACRQNAVTELVFNMGLTTWTGFHNTRNAIQVRNWAAAHDGLLKSAWAAEVHAERANRLANYLLSGAYPNAFQQG